MKALLAGLLLIVATSVQAGELVAFQFTTPDGKSGVLTFPADGKEYLLTGYSTFGATWLVQRVEVIPERALPTTIEIRMQPCAAAPYKVPPMVVSQRKDGATDVISFAPAAVEWPGGCSAGLYGKAKGTGTQSVRVIVRYLVEDY